ncbi:hypothetical protein HELRODRAFT_166970 [Helobdella robusta]|uniref:Uncharacterized protein n=1 Tax=Helobdella robusta TaxID=6412 RepID=T1EYU0_HELRO|nr:hypothetical protein HELRODRAFT_166970 [Helobdella robusta]ESO11884.1 hypothetical protein HELRODRAFT_166970 [Helobdella robusta]
MNLKFLNEDDKVTQLELMNKEKSLEIETLRLNLGSSKKDSEALRHDFGSFKNEATKPTIGGQQWVELTAVNKSTGLPATSQSVFSNNDGPSNASVLFPKIVANAISPNQPCFDYSSAIDSHDDAIDNFILPRNKKVKRSVGSPKSTHVNKSTGNVDLCDKQFIESHLRDKNVIFFACYPVLKRKNLDDPPVDETTKSTVFKIVVPVDESSKLLNPDIWPRYTFFRQWDFSRSKKSLDVLSNNKPSDHGSSK